MNGHVKSMCSQQQPMGPATTLLSLLLVMAVDLTRPAAASRNPQCGNSLQQTLKLNRLVQKESADLMKTYKDSQGDMSDHLCTMSVGGIPDASISGLEPSERIASIFTHIQDFLPHFKRVFQQQTDLQPPMSQMLIQLVTVRTRSQYLAAFVNDLYQSLFPNLPMPEPAGGPTTLPPPQNVFQQKVYGCDVLKTYREFLSNVSKELRSLKGQLCRRRTAMNTLLLLRMI